MNEYKVLNAFELEGVMQEVGSIVSLTVEQASAEGIVGNVEAVNTDAGIMPSDTVLTVLSNEVGLQETPAVDVLVQDGAAAPTTDAPAADAAPSTPADTTPNADSVAASEEAPAPTEEKPNFVGQHSVSGE